MEDVTYVVPGDLSELFKVMGRHRGRAKVIAGGTNVIPDMRAGAVAPEVIIDLGRLRGALSYVREENGRVSIGALTNISEVASSEIIQRDSPILSSAASRLGNPLTRNRATIGGNLADASPAADMAPPLLALEAEVSTECERGRGREIPLDRFFLGPNQTILEEGEVITQITFPKPKTSAKGSHIKLGLRNSMAISVVSIAVMLELKGKRCRQARVALGAVAPKPIRAYCLEGLLEGREIDSKVIGECSVAVMKEISPITDIRGSAEYRKLATSVLLRRAIQEALA